MGINVGNVGFCESRIYIINRELAYLYKVHPFRHCFKISLFFRLLPRLCANHDFACAITQSWSWRPELGVSAL